jgi:DNA-binding NarL/FixJ family response regulator
MTVVATVESAGEALEAVERHRPELVLVDLGLPDRSGLELGPEILEAHPGTKVVALTANEDPRVVAKALRSGFVGYIPKTLPGAAFVRSIESIVEGQLVAPQPLVQADQSARDDRGSNPIEMLTPRELQVLALLVGGATSEEMAASLSVSLHTVRTHVQNILAKLQVHSRLQATAVALSHGIVKAPTVDG